MVEDLANYDMLGWHEEFVESTATIQDGKCVDLVLNTQLDLEIVNDCENPIANKAKFMNYIDRFATRKEYDLKAFLISRENKKRTFKEFKRAEKSYTEAREKLFDETLVQSLMEPLLEEYDRYYEYYSHLYRSHFITKLPSDIENLFQPHFVDFQKYFKQLIKNKQVRLL